MSDNERRDAVRRDALRHMERSEMAVKLSIVAAALVEAACLGLFLFLMDFSNRGHVLLLVATCLIYMTLGLGLMALGAHVSRTGLRILKALERTERP